MEKETIIKTIRHHLQNEILGMPNQTIEDDEPLISSGLIDSFSLVDVSLFVEDTYDVHIDDTELNADTFDDLNTLADLIISRQAAS